MGCDVPRGTLRVAGCGLRIEEEDPHPGPLPGVPGEGETRCAVRHIAVAGLREGRPAPRVRSLRAGGRWVRSASSLCTGEREERCAARHIAFPLHPTHPAPYPHPHVTV